MVHRWFESVCDAVLTFINDVEESVADADFS